MLRGKSFYPSSGDGSMDFETLIVGSALLGPPNFLRSPVISLTQPSLSVYHRSLCVPIIDLSDYQMTMNNLVNGILTMEHDDCNIYWAAFECWLCLYCKYPLLIIMWICFGLWISHSKINCQPTNRWKSMQQNYQVLGNESFRGFVLASTEYWHQ